MHQHHGHNHSHKDLKGRNLIISILLNILITVSQVIGGIISGSLALLSDALHNFSDVLSLFISYVATVLSKKEASTNKTFGYKRAEIIVPGAIILQSPRAGSYAAAGERLVGNRPTYQGYLNSWTITYK